MKKDPSKPQTCIQIEGMPSVRDPAIRVLQVPVLQACPESFAAFGRLVTDYQAEQVFIETWPASGWRPVEAGTGNEGGIVEGHFEFSRTGSLMIARNHAVDGHYITGWFNDPASAGPEDTAADYRQVLVREANYHPDSGQVFYPLNAEPFIALLALPGDDVRPQDFVAFYCDGSFGIQIFPNIWHQPVFPLTAEASFIGKQGKVHACIACDFIREFGCYLSVPLQDFLYKSSDSGPA
ncbi:MAG: ureidoglycolate lyase [Gammaproteobacteria bacterium]|nr:ureidoglycolate lyase [Gammaproteobacteria bacterium]